MRTICTILIAIALAACGTTYKRPAGVSQAQGQQDLAHCKRIALAGDTYGLGWAAADAALEAERQRLDACLLGKGYRRTN